MPEKLLCNKAEDDGTVLPPFHDRSLLRQISHKVRMGSCREHPALDEICKQPNLHYQDEAVGNFQTPATLGLCITDVLISLIPPSDLQPVELCLAKFLRSVARNRVALGGESREM